MSRACAFHRALIVPRRQRDVNARSYREAMCLGSGGLQVITRRNLDLRIECVRGDHGEVWLNKKNVYDVITVFLPPLPSDRNAWARGNPSVMFVHEYATYRGKMKRAVSPGVSANVARLLPFRRR